MRSNVTSRIISLYKSSDKKMLSVHIEILFRILIYCEIGFSAQTLSIKAAIGTFSGSPELFFAAVLDEFRRISYSAGCDGTLFLQIALLFKRVA